MLKAVKDAVASQRELTIQEHENARKVIETEGGEIIEPTPGEHAAFVEAVQPQLREARQKFGRAMFDLVPAG
jgi:TRAP-type C4-dicarboxylate transport system substrate-binding protein